MVSQVISQFCDEKRQQNKSKFMSVVTEKIEKIIDKTVDLPAFIYAERKYENLEKAGKIDILGRLKIKKGEKW